MKKNKNILVIGLVVIAIVMVILILNQFVNGKSKVGQNPALEGTEDRETDTNSEESNNDETNNSKEDIEANVEVKIEPTDINIEQLLDIVLNVGNIRFVGDMEALKNTSDKNDVLALDEATYEEVLYYFEGYQGENEALDVTSEVGEVAKLKAEDDETRENLKKYTYEDYLADFNKAKEDANNSSDDTYDINDDTEDIPVEGYEGMVSDLYDSKGNKVWTGLGIKGAKEATDEQRAEYGKIVKQLNENIKNSNKGKEDNTNGNDTTDKKNDYASDVEMLTKEEWDAAYRENMGDSQFNDKIDSRIIKDINEVYTINLTIDDFYTGYVMVNVYGINKKIEIPEQKIMTSLTTGNVRYEFSIKEYEILNDGTFNVQLANGISGITIRGGVKNGNQIYFENVENIFNYDYEYISDATGWVQ